jgi:hypothetical protein
MHGIYINHDCQSASGYAQKLAATVRAASVECPEAVERNAAFLRDTINEIREAAAAIEAKLPKPREVSDVKAA